MEKNKDYPITILMQQAYALYSRNYLYRYQGMKMKYMWHIVMPCLPIFLYNILNLLDVFGSSSGGPPRSITISIGITFYYLFSETLVGFSSVLEGNKSYIIKTGVSFKACYFSVLYSVYSNFIIRLIIILVMLGFYEGYYHLGLFFSVPYSILPVLVGASLGLLLSVFTVFYKDFNNFVQAISFYMLFGSGVFAKIDGESLFEKTFMNLPTYVTVNNAKGLMLQDFPFDLSIVVIWLGVSLLVCGLSVIAIKNSKSLVVNYLR